MRVLSESELLSAWERSIDKPLLASSLQLIALACDLPDTSIAAQMSIGERDARLLRLREWMFGATLRNKAPCPACAETLEWINDTKLFHLQMLPSFPYSAAPLLAFNFEDFHLQFRLPNSLDIFRAMQQYEQYTQSPKRLLSECIVEVQKAGTTVDVDSLPSSLFDALALRIEQEDPQANIQMELNCPNCQHRWVIFFDVQSYLWAEIDNWAKHFLYEIFLLARTFGWSERDILNMHPLRRQLYLEMLRS